ncbi:MAG: GNAT family N-acetyltransferase [Bacteroidetes bacterium]|nr:MAG: GNAT family N-acetyltransferase [Bacteroidota bacterium]
MKFREATIEDIDPIHTVRMSVKENILVNLSLVTKDDYIRLLTQDGKGWVCETDFGIVAFSIVDTIKKNVWALFVHPDFEAKGIGSTIHNLMLDWYFSHEQETLWLSTDAETRADKFYREAGWKEVMRFGKNEIKFEMTFEEWKNQEKNIS